MRAGRASTTVGTPSSLLAGRALARFHEAIDARRRIRQLTAALTVLDLVGARVARGHGLIGEPLRIRIPAAVPTPLVLVGWGTAVSAPWLMDAALARVLAGHDADRARTVARGLGALRCAGVLVEPATWGRRRPRWAMALSIGNLVLGAALVRAAGRAPGTT